MTSRREVEAGQPREQGIRVVRVMCHKGHTRASRYSRVLLEWWRSQSRGNSLVSRETRQTHVERRRCSQGIIRCVAHGTFILSCARPFARAAPLLEIACEDIVQNKTLGRNGSCNSLSLASLGLETSVLAKLGKAETDEYNSRRTIYKYELARGCPCHSRLPTPPFNPQAVPKNGRS